MLNAAQFELAKQFANRSDTHVQMRGLCEEKSKFLDIFLSIFSTLNVV